ncbi:MAG: CAP domain-containing protein [Cyanobium sp.]
MISTADFLQAETNLATDLDGDGKTGFSFSPAKTIGTIQFGSSQLGYALKNGSNPLLSITNAGAVATEAGGWSAIAAATAGSGYDLYWKNANGTYAKWILNSSAALTSGSVISTSDFLQAETNLATDLDGDGKTGFSFLPSSTIGNIQFGSTQFGYAFKDGTASPIQITYPTPSNPNQIASPSSPGANWVAVAAAAAGSAYSLYWKNSVTLQFARWTLNASGLLTSSATLTSDQLYAEESSLNFDLDADGSIGLTLTPSPSSTSTIYSGSFATPNEVDSYSVDVAPGTIISASITTPSQQSLYPLINLFDTSSSLLKGSLTYSKDFADLGMFDLITGKATLNVGTQTGFLGDYELKLSLINREAVKNEVVSLTNAQRLQVGLNPLTRNQLLESAAQAHVADMDASNRYLAHTGSNGSDPVTRIAATGYKGGLVDLGNGQLRMISSENAASGQKTPAEVVNAWMNSPGHRAAILDPYTKEIGIGFEFDNEVGDMTAQSYKIGTTYWVQNFGYPWQTGMQVWF